jgi:hypothetical protein
MFEKVGAVYVELFYANTRPSAVKQLGGQTTRKAETFVAVDMARPAASDASRVKL